MGTSRLTMRFHGEYIFGCASCGKRFSGEHAYDSLVAHQKKGKCPLPDDTFLTLDSWNKYQNHLTLNHFYKEVTANSVTDINVEIRKVKQEEEDQEKKRKQEERKSKKEEKKKLKTKTMEELDKAGDDVNLQEEETAIDEVKETRDSSNVTKASISTSSRTNTETECENTPRRSTRKNK